jgi:hypothetical protein
MLPDSTHFVISRDKMSFRSLDKRQFGQEETGPKYYPMFALRGFTLRKLSVCMNTKWSVDPEHRMKNSFGVSLLL